ncbi:MAG: glycosyltransferase family 39 protein [Candidatus Omnitrophota bacterium]
MRVLNEAEPGTLFISSSIVNGVMPYLSFFHPNLSFEGGGHFIYALISAPFMLFFGKSYFSLRLASLPFLALIYFLMYKFCNRYFNLRTAVFASLLLVFASEFSSRYSIVGDGRYFHLNLFFICSLYLFSKIREKKDILYYFLFGLICALGVYFYPAFLVSVIVFLLFLFWDIDRRNPYSIYGFFIIILWLIVAGNFLILGTPWNQAFYNAILWSPKTILPSGDIFLILPRAVITIFLNVPTILLTSHRVFFRPVFLELVKVFSTNFYNLKGGYLNMFLIIFSTALCFLSWKSKVNFKKIFYKAPFFVKRKNNNIPVDEYIVVFLLSHLFMYGTLFSFNSRITNKLYYLPLGLTVILLIAIFLNDLYKKRAYISVFFLFFILIPGGIHQFTNLKIARTKNFYKHYAYFYQELHMIDLMKNKSISVHRSMCDNMDLRICHTLGLYYCLRSYPPKIKFIQGAFKYISRGQADKLRQLYQGFFVGYGCIRKVNIKDSLQIIGKFDKEFHNYCYMGIGEGIFNLCTTSFGVFDFKKEKDKESIEKIAELIEENYRGYFFTGLGKGLARRFAVAYSPYITKGAVGNIFYDKDILNYYSDVAENKGYKDAFLLGFFKRDIWTKF